MPASTDSRTDLALASALARERDSACTVVLIGFKRQGNLGLGYLAATLELAGYRVEVVDFEEPPAAILDAVRRLRPILVGFSLIFQFHVHRFESLARRLREGGVECHFTIGGHFPSLSPAETLRLMPQLDSVVAFEGELTLLELVDAVSLDQSWREIDGIVRRDGDQVASNRPRALLADLDELPFPHRVVDTRTILGRSSAQLIASRGCARTCSFCSIHMFYRLAPGKVVRTRRPAEVAREMRYLYDERGATIFLFQDDDFPIFGPAWHRWCRELLDEIAGQDLVGKTLWKINCRADAVDPVLLSEMREAGLYLVYMGLESGSDEGLRTLHKQTTVEQNIRAVDILKDLDIQFDFGFMMLDPSSTFDSIADNVSFLRRIVGDGYAAAEFCRMIPYDGTPIKDELEREGRLRGDVCNPDYDLLDPRLEIFFQQIDEALKLTGWIHGLEALSPNLKFALNEYAIMERLSPNLPGLPAYRATIQQVTRESNDVLFSIVEELADAAQHGRRAQIDQNELAEQSLGFLTRLVDRRNEFVVQNEQALVDALDESQLEATAAR